MALKIFTATAIAICRSFSTKSSSQLKKYGRTNARKAKIDEPRVEWTEEQKQVLHWVGKGLSVFVTGSAGTGKTVLLEHIIRILKRTHRRSRVFVTASTGVAACALCGQTLHSFVGAGLMDGDDRDAVLDKVLMNKRACRRWKRAEVLVIDEISMIDVNMFENLDYVARSIRGSSEVWGGIQLIVSGDFFQLPPVSAKWNSSSKVFAFEADCWDASFDKQFELTSVFRQSDPRLLKLLQEIRRGETGSDDFECLEMSCSTRKPDDSVVRLYPLMADVNKVNDERMKSLDKRVFTYAASDGGLGAFKMQLKQGIAPDQLALCEGARVMLIKNLNVWQNLCNGATGTVTGFVESKDEIITHLSADNLLPVVKLDSGPEMVMEPQRWEILDGDVPIAWRYQIPLILAWALSIHKCQGMSLNSLHTDLSRCFSYGMVYVALSRVRSFEGLYLSGFSTKKIKAHPKVSRFYERLANEQRGANEEARDDAQSESRYKLKHT